MAMDAMERGMRPPVYQDFAGKMKEVQVEGDQACQFNKKDVTVEVMDFLTKSDPESEKKGWILRNVLTKEECAALIDVSEGRGYQAAAEYCYMYYHRKNDRLMCDDTELADFLWKRIAPHVPSQLQFQTSNTFEACGLNNRFRICRYDGGGHFGIHSDGTFATVDTRSFLTCMLYLNSGEAGGDFTGGHTDFIENTSSRDVQYSLVPETGMCVVFRQQDPDCLHCGTTVESGKKYILRTDIMFKCRVS